MDLDITSHLVQHRDLPPLHECPNTVPKQNNAHALPQTPDMADLQSIPADPADSKRAFQTQFRRWGFPLKQNPVYRDARLAARVRELWERNLPQREMLRVLSEDGFEVRERELVRLRARNGLMLRDPRGDRQEAAAPASPAGSSSPGVSREDGAEEVVFREEEGKGLTKRRRRRTRGWAGRPADPPGPPRFPSETTIDEARVILGLDGEGYRAVRAGFQRICEEGGLVKKTLAGPERWEAAKAQLVREVPQLQAPPRAGTPDDKRKGLALDIICTDVTKRMRDGDRRMTLADAKKVLGINPEEARSLRAGFYRVLARQEVQVRCKSTAGAERWGALMAEWMAESEVARALLPGDEGSAEYRERWKALDILATDVMKRMRDERMRKEARGKRGSEGSSKSRTEVVTPEVPEASPASVQTSPPTECSVEEGSMPVMSDYGPVSPMPMLVNEPMQVPALPMDHISSPRLVLDPPADMTLPARLNTQLLVPGETAYEQQQHQQQQQQQPYFMASPLPYSPPTIAVYLRLHPSSTYMTGTPLWIATLGSHSLRELREVAAGKFGDAVCVGVEGVVRDGKGGECALGIGGDEELGAYLAHLEGATPTFNVTLAWRG